METRTLDQWKQDNADKCFIRANYFQVNTGGGCTAWELSVLGEDSYIWITDVNDPSIPASFDTICCACLYFNDHCIKITDTRNIRRTIQYINESIQF